MELSRRELFVSMIATALMTPVVAQAGVPPDKYDRLIERYQAVKSFAPNLEPTSSAAVKYWAELKKDPAKNADYETAWTALFQTMLDEFPAPKIDHVKRLPLMDADGVERYYTCAVAESGEVYRPMSILNAVVQKDGERVHRSIQPTKEFLKSIPDYEITAAVVKHIVSVDRAPIPINLEGLWRWASENKWVILL